MGNVESKNTKNIPEQYDVIIDIGKFSDLITTGWYVLKQEKLKMDSFDGAIVTVTGLFNKGKTFLLNKLTGSTFSSTNVDRTPGLCVKFLENNIRKHALFDTAGRGTPVVAKDVNNETDPSMVMERLIEEKTNSEEFLLSVSVNLSDFILVVVNDLTRYDQDLINKVTRMRNDGNKQFKDIFIVHNLRNINTEQEYKLTFKELKALYQDSQLLKDDVDIIKVSPDKKTITSVSVVQFFRHANCRHVIIVNDNCSFGEITNPPVIQLLKKWINAIMPDHTRENWLSLAPFVDTCKIQIRKYVDDMLKKQNKKFKDLVFQNHKIFMLTENENANTGPNDSTIDTSNNGLNSPVQYSVFTRNGDFYVEIETPGMSENDISISYVTAVTANHFAVKISGTKKSTKIEGDIEDRPTNRFFGNFERIIEIPVMKDNKILYNIGLGEPKEVKNGITTFVWKKWQS